MLAIPPLGFPHPRPGRVRPPPPGACLPPPGRGFEVPGAFWPPVPDVLAPPPGWTLANQAAAAVGGSYGGCMLPPGWRPELSRSPTPQPGFACLADGRNSPREGRPRSASPCRLLDPSSAVLNGREPSSSVCVPPAIEGVPKPLAANVSRSISGPQTLSRGGSSSIGRLGLQQQPPPCPTPPYPQCPGPPRQASGQLSPAAAPPPLSRPSRSCSPRTERAAIQLQTERVTSPRDTVWKRYFSPDVASPSKGTAPSFSYGMTGQGALSADPGSAQALAVAAQPGHQVAAGFVTTAGCLGSSRTLPPHLLSGAVPLSVAMPLQQFAEATSPRPGRSASLGAFPTRRTLPAAVSASSSFTPPPEMPPAMQPVAPEEVTSATPAAPLSGCWLPSAPAGGSLLTGGSPLAQAHAAVEFETARSTSNSAVSFRNTQGHFGAAPSNGPAECAHDCDSTVPLDDSHAGPLMSPDLADEEATSFVIQKSPFPTGPGHDELSLNVQEPVLSPLRKLLSGPESHGGGMHCGSGNISLGSSTVTMPGEALSSFSGPRPPSASSPSSASPVAQEEQAGQSAAGTASGSPAQPAAPEHSSGGSGKLLRTRSASPSRGSSRRGDLAAAARALAPRLQDEELSVAAAAEAVKLRDLRELRSFRNPPSVVLQVFEAVATVLSISDPSWVKMKRLLDNSFLGRIQSFDPSKIIPQQAERLTTLLQAPAFSDSQLAERCPAVVALAAWCNAVGRALPPAPSSALLAPTPARAQGMKNSASSRTPVQRREGPAESGSQPERSSSEAPLPGGRRRQMPKRLQSRPDLDGLEVLPDLWSLSQADLARVRELSVSRKGVGVVTFHGSTDCRALVGGNRLAQIVLLRPGEVIVYPDQDKKPPVGVGLNKPATITLYGCLPKVKGSWDDQMREKYKNRVKHMTQAKGAELVEYDCDQGVWQFRVQHF